MYIVKYKPQMTSCYEIEGPVIGADQFRSLGAQANAIVNLSTGMGGYIQSHRSYPSNNQFSLETTLCGHNLSLPCLMVTMTIKIPVTSFDQFVDAIRSLVEASEVTCNGALAVGSLVELIIKTIHCSPRSLISSVCR